MIKKVKLADFGISLPAAQVEDELIGTPQYLAPELFLQKPPQWSQAADVWALACTCIAVATGHPPYKFHPDYPFGTSEYPNIFVMGKAFEKHENLQPVIPSFLSERLRGLLRDMLKRDKRPNARELLQRPYFKKSTLKDTYKTCTTEAKTQLEKWANYEQRVADWRRLFANANGEVTQLDSAREVMTVQQGFWNNAPTMVTL